MKNVIKKVIVSLMTIILSLGYVGIVANADTGKNSSMYWYSYNANGVVSGDDNNKFYRLTPGNVSYRVTSTSGTSKLPVYMYLKRQRFLADASYAVKTVDSTGTYRWYIEDDSDKYYIFAYSFQYNRNEYICGTIHDHY